MIELIDVSDSDYSGDLDSENNSIENDMVELMDIIMSHLSDSECSEDLLVENNIQIGYRAIVENENVRIILMLHLFFKLIIYEFNI